MSRILVIGGSLGGLLAANVLHRQEHDVCVLEKVRGSMDGRGAGIVTHDALFAGLQRAGLNIDDSLGVPFRQRVALSAEGGTEVCIDMPQVQPRYAGYVAWRGVCDEAVLSERTLTSVFETFGFGLPAGEQLIGYPVAGPGNDTRQGHRACNFVWYRQRARCWRRSLPR
jgi:2-polyprenyl-6-methoxyphenol hydroxylase-like FAD-dependent oxidoreductase